MSEDQSPVDDLFGDEGIRIESEGPEVRRPKTDLPVKGWILGAAVIGLALLWWWSSYHHDRFYLTVQDGQVSIERGYFFPFGKGEWAPNRAYESFLLPADIEPMKTGGMSAKHLDRTLKKLFMDVARRELNDLKSGRVDVAEDMLMRGQKLRSTSVSDDRVLLRLLGDVAFRRGLTEVKGLQSRFDEALTQFRLAHRRGGNVYKGAKKWVKAISKLRLEFKRLSLESGIDPDLLLRNLDGSATPSETAEAAMKTVPNATMEATGTTPKPSKEQTPATKPAR